MNNCKSLQISQQTSSTGPSPDWVVGVNGLNLCLKNCSWIENLVVDLYPYDAGTDSGITYMVSRIFVQNRRVNFAILFRVRMPKQILEKECTE